MNSRYLLALAIALTACTHTIKTSDEPVIDTLTDRSGARPEWIRKIPTQPGKVVIVTSATEGLSAEAGLRLAKAYAFAEISEMMTSNVQVDSRMATKNRLGLLQETISWKSSSWIRSMRLEDSYWEKRSTIEGPRYSVWTLWSLPEKAFYEAQQDQPHD